MPTHFAGTLAEVRALNALIALSRASESVAARTQRHLAADRLTGSQFGVLEALYHLGPLCQRDLGAKLLRSGGNVTLVVDNLEKGGLVRRERDATDRRQVQVHLTPAGRRLIKKVFPRHVAGVVAEMRTLTAREQDTLRRLCRKLGRKD